MEIPCLLCGLVFSYNKKDTPIYEDQDCIILHSGIKNLPIIISKTHIGYLNESKVIYLKRKLLEYCGKEEDKKLLKSGKKLVKKELEKIFEKYTFNSSPQEKRHFHLYLI